MAIFLVDAFADGPFTGNPAGVCLLDSPRDEGFYQAVAAELRCSETAFALLGEDPIRLRWFTPEVEVDLCGHATLATAHVLLSTGLRSGPLVFSTRSGLIGAAPKGPFVEIDLPALPPSARAIPPELRAALGAEVRSLHQSRFDWLAELTDAESVRALAPDLSSIARLECRGLIVTALDDGGESDFVSRFFAPSVGIDEDPVTGSAHCVLGPFWGARLGRDELVGRQLSRRGGTVRVHLAGERVLLAGRVRTVLAGDLVEDGGEGLPLRCEAPAAP